MPGNPHPAQQWLDDRNATEALAYDRLHIRVQVADAAEVRNTDLSGQYGGLYIRDNAANYNISTSITAEDDGESVVIDAAGNHFIKVVDSASPVAVTYGDADVSGGAVTLGDEDFAIINTSTMVNVNVPAKDDRNGKPILIKDAGGHGFTPDLDGAETIDGASAAGFAVTTPKGWIELVPTTGGYFVKSAQL